MSYDLTFWREVASRTSPPVDIYRSLCRGESVDGIAELTIEEIRAAFAAEFPELELEPDQLHGPMFSVWHASRPIRAVFLNASWKLPGHHELMGSLIRVATEHLGCVCYDPQRDAMTERASPGDSGFPGTIHK